MGQIVVDYYEILGTAKDSTLYDIKKSFRKRAKEIHPDLNTEAKEDISSEEMMLLIQAYKVLSNPSKRREYDRINFFQFKPDVNAFNYREFLRERKDDLTSQSKLIFYDLINSNSEEALELYEELLEQDSYDMEKCMNRADYLECLFLLAEEFEKRGEYMRAFQFLKLLYLRELDNAFFKHFVEEIVDRMKNMVCFKMIGITPPELMLQLLQELVGLNFSSKDTAFFYKKMAEISIKLGNKPDAVKYLKLGLKFNKKLSGIKKLKERIGL